MARMPFEDGEFNAKRRQQRIGPAIGGDADPVPAEFAGDP